MIVYNFLKCAVPLTEVIEIYTVPVQLLTSNFLTWVSDQLNREGEGNLLPFLLIVEAGYN
jgi:hypothetical protein